MTRALFSTFILALSAQVAAAPAVDIGERRFTGGSGVTHIAVCDAEHALSTEWYGVRANRWHLPDGEPLPVLGPLEEEWQFLACDGALSLLGRHKNATLFDGDKVVKRVELEDAMAGTIVGGKALVILASGEVHEVSKAGTKRLWTAKDVSGYHSILRADLAVLWSDDELAWATPKGTKKLKMPSTIAAVADLGDAIAVADKKGDVRILTGPKLTAPVLHVDADTDGEITSLGGNTKWLGVGTYDAHFIQLARTPKAKPLAAIELIPLRMSRSLRAIAISGDRWLVGADDNRIYPVPLGATTFKRAAIDGHDDTVWTVAYDGTTLISGGSDAAVQVRAANGKLDKTVGPSNGRPVLNVGLTGGIVWAVDDYHGFSRWKRKGMSPLPVLENIHDAAALDDKRLVVIDRGNLEILDIASGKLTTIAGYDKLYDGKLQAAKNTVVIMMDGGNTRKITIVDVTNGKTLASLEFASIEFSFALSPDGTQLAITTDETIQVWSRATGKVTALGAQDRPISALAYAPDGRLATGDWNGVVKIWAPKAKNSGLSFIAHSGHIESLVWHKNQLASGGADMRVKIHNVAP